MSDVPSRGELILYRTEDGRDAIRLRVTGGAVCRPSIEAEIFRSSVVKESLTTACEQYELPTYKDFLQVRPECLCGPEAQL